jgi:hypothetical protein
MCCLRWWFSHRLPPSFRILRQCFASTFETPCGDLYLFFVASGGFSCGSRRRHRFGVELELYHHVAGAIQTEEGMLARQRRMR